MTDWKQILIELVKEPQQHARFLNTISLMEYMGARKIMKSQKESVIDREVLAHMTEEIRHAQIFKKMALKLSEGHLKTYDDEYLLAGAAGRAYIQSVDQSVAAALNGEDSHYNYLLSTLLIEERANTVYPFYADLMEPLGFASYIKTILREEEHHLEQIQTELQKNEKLTSQKLAALRMIEQKAFNFLMISAYEEFKGDSDWIEKDAYL